MVKSEDYDIIQLTDWIIHCTSNITRRQTHTHAHTYMHEHIHTLTHTHTYTHAHTYTHTIFLVNMFVYKVRCWIILLGCVNWMHLVFSIYFLLCVYDPEILSYLPLFYFYNLFVMIMIGLYNLLWVGPVLFLYGWCNKYESKVTLPNVSAGQVLRLRRKTQNQS
jgi:hypothetical protein